MLRLIVRLVVALGIVAVVLHDGGQILFAQTRADDIAQRAAQNGAETFKETKNVNQARADAVAYARAEGARLKSFSMAPDGKATVRVALRASTLIVRRVSFLQKFGVRRATVTAGPPVL